MWVEKLRLEILSQSGPAGLRHKQRSSCLGPQVLGGLTFFYLKFKVPWSIKGPNTQKFTFWDSRFLKNLRFRRTEYFVYPTVKLRLLLTETSAREGLQCTQLSRNQPKPFELQRKLFFHVLKKIRKYLLFKKDEDVSACLLNCVTSYTDISWIIHYSIDMCTETAKYSLSIEFLYGMNVAFLNANRNLCSPCVL